MSTSFTFNSVDFTDLNIVVTNRPRPNIQEPDVAVYATASGTTMTYNRGNKPRTVVLRCEFTPADSSAIGDVQGALEAARDAGEAALSIGDWEAESYSAARVFTIGEISVVGAVGIFEITFLIL